MRHFFQIAASMVALLTFVAQAQAEPVPPPAKSIKAEANFVSPDGAWYGKFAQHYEKTRMLDRIVELVRKARAKGVLVVHITEGYTSDYRELDPTNPGMFHRGQIGRGAWKIGSKEAAYYEPLKPSAEDRDLFLPPRSQASGFGGTGLSELLRSKGIKNVAVAGFTSDVCVYATALSASTSMPCARAWSASSTGWPSKWSTSSIRCGRRSSTTTSSTKWSRRARRPHGKRRPTKTSLEKER
jgi:ureidoacrylate peracid hydrolase